MFQMFARTISRFIQLACIYLLAVFLIATFAGSFLRYGFDEGSVRLEDFIKFAFAALVVLSILVAFIKNAHVRVTAFSGLKDFQESILGRVLSALPFISIALLSLPAVMFSWAILEGSAEQGGLGGLFLVKSLLPLSFVLIAFFLGFNLKEKLK